jgi:hypothetical protein
MIKQISNSPVKHKRLRVYMDNGKHYDFGYKSSDGKLGSTYIDHHDKTKRKNYWLRHLGNPTEKKLIKNLVPSSSLFSAMLLWGEYETLEQNAFKLNELWEAKHKN